MPSYVLTYFPVPARAEVLRLTLAVSGAKWENVSLKGEEWATMKAEIEESNKQGKPFRFPSLPHLKVKEDNSESEKVISQSLSALRFLARKHDLYGQNDWEMVQVDSIVDLYTDFFKGYIPIMFSPTPDTPAEAFCKDFDTKGNYLEMILGKSKSGFLVGEKLTIADIVIFSVLKQSAITIESKCSKHKLDLSKFPKLKAHHEKIAATEQIKSYYKTK